MSFHSDRLLEDLESGQGVRPPPITRVASETLRHHCQVAKAYFVLGFWGIPILWILNWLMYSKQRWSPVSPIRPEEDTEESRAEYTKDIERIYFYASWSLKLFAMSTAALMMWILAWQVAYASGWDEAKKLLLSCQSVTFNQ